MTRVEPGKIRVRIVVEGEYVCGAWSREKDFDEDFVKRALVGREAAKMALQEDLFGMLKLVVKRSREAK